MLNDALSSCSSWHLKFCQHSSKMIENHQEQNRIVYFFCKSKFIQPVNTNAYKTQATGRCKEKIGLRVKQQPYKKGNIKSNKFLGHLDNCLFKSRFQYS